MKLHQTGEDTYVCFISDYWHLQPWYIEQEMRAGTLHIYKLVFSCGYILRGVEEMMPTFGDVYEVSMIDDWCKHLLEAVVAPLICTGLPAARAWNLQT
jgi:hypothetical protein